MLTKTDEYFITIAKVGNLNQASKILYVSQPSLSKYIQRLEERLGTQCNLRRSAAAVAFYNGCPALINGW